MDGSHTDVLTNHADALRRGDLVGVTWSGRSIPVVFTRKAWDLVVDPQKNDDIQGRLESVLNGFVGAVRLGIASSRVIFSAIIDGRTKRLVAVYGPDDDRRPVITIQMPWEDRG